MQFRVVLTSVMALFVSGFQVGALGPETSPRPTVRSTEILKVAAKDHLATRRGLQEWMAGFRVRAVEAGIQEALFDQVMQGVTYDAETVKRDRNQAEFTKTIWDYLDTAVSDLRIANGQKALSKWDGMLTNIEARFGVEKEVIVAIWGLESAYGTFRGTNPVINGLATLAYDARRADFFEAELMHALRILQNGDITSDRMRGSWAGAMGHTQFMPSSYQSHAVDWNKDGKRDIWGDNPQDALASTAAYLKHYGWTKGQPWGGEVRLPDGFEYTLADREILKLPSEWEDLGVRTVDGSLKDAYGPASVLLPGGAQGAAFMIFSNFAVIEKYNTADAYVVGIGHLSDRITGGKEIEHTWPRQLRALSKDERIELQKRLTAAGFDTVKIDAKMGPLTINAVRRFQQSQGILPDGYPSLQLLDRLRAL